MIRTKRVYEPRDVSKDKIDGWERELGTSKELIKAWKGKEPLLEKWAERAKEEY